MFKWVPSMQIDNGLIDEDHRKLIAIANRVLTLDKPDQDIEDLKQAIKELYDYVRYHFKREEDFMQKLGYPELIHHHQKHEAIIKDMNRYLTSAHHLDDVLKSFRGLVDHWVIGHIMEEDRKIHAFMEAKLAASKPDIHD